MINKNENIFYQKIISKQFLYTIPIIILQKKKNISFSMKVH